MPLMTPVSSSMVAEVGYDPETFELHVRWYNGKTSVYEGVSEADASLVMGAHSVGRAIIDHIKPNFSHRYL